MTRFAIAFVLALSSSAFANSAPSSTRMGALPDLTRVCVDSRNRVLVAHDNVIECVNAACAGTRAPSRLVELISVNKTAESTNLTELESRLEMNLQSVLAQTTTDAGVVGIAEFYKSGDVEMFCSNNYDNQSFVEQSLGRELKEARF